jgi:nicotinamide mononucleotide transporter
MRDVELAANALNAASIVLAGRNSVHTWWTGIAGCALFAWVFYAARLYADVTLQGFFVATSAMGWWVWVRGANGAELPVSRTAPRARLLIAGAVLLGATAYGSLLRATTDAYAPFVDSLVLTFSVAGQLLLVRRRIETWWCWLLVDTVAVPLYLTRGLWVTAALYVAFWLNAAVALVHWRRQLGASALPPSRAAVATPVEAA